MNKRILPFAVAAMALTLTLASCSDNETEVATFANTYEQTLAQSDSASVQIVHSVEYYKSFEGGNALKKKINNSIVKACFGEKYDGFSVEEASDAVSDTLIANYQREAGSVYDDAVAYRFVSTARKGGFNVAGEQAEFNFAGNLKTWIPYVRTITIARR